MKNDFETGVPKINSAIGIMALILALLSAANTNADMFSWDPVSEASGYRVYYSTDSTVGPPDPSVEVDSQTTQYELCLLPLNPCVTYYVQVSAYNTMGEIFMDSPAPYAKNTPQITVPPQATNILHDSATIQWTTLEGSTSVVNYGTTTSYGSAESSTAYVNNHSIDLTGLSPNTTYHYMATSFDPDNCGPGCNASNNSPPGDSVFTTQQAPDLTPPVITSGPTATAITTTTAVIEWTTDESSTSSVYFDSDASGEPYAFFEGDPDMVTAHSLPLNGLTAGTTYYCRVGSTDALGNGPTYSSEITFTTDAVPVPPGNLRIIN